MYLSRQCKYNMKNRGFRRRRTYINFLLTTTPQGIIPRISIPYLLISGSFAGLRIYRQNKDVLNYPKPVFSILCNNIQNVIFLRVL
uniref:Uncharacterized protein n=1 Tax=Strigamia maritima TaxID=126957 RepID=T1JMH2_STRMM